MSATVDLPLPARPTIAIRFIVPSSCREAWAAPASAPPHDRSPHPNRRNCPAPRAHLRPGSWRTRRRPTDQPGADEIEGEVLDDSAHRGALDHALREDRLVDHQLGGL